MSDIDNGMEFDGTSPNNNSSGGIELGAMPPMMPPPGMPLPPFAGMPLPGMIDGMPGMPLPGMIDFEAMRKKSKKEKKEKKEKKHKRDKENKDSDEKSKAERKERKEKKKRDREDGDKDGEKKSKKRKSGSDDGSLPLAPLAMPFPMPMPGMPGMPLPGLPGPLGMPPFPGPRLMTGPDGKLVQMAKPIDMAEIAKLDAMRSFGQASLGDAKGGKGFKGKGKGKGGKADNMQSNLPNPQNDPNYPDSFANRRARELYVGGLQIGPDQRDQIQIFFADILTQLDEFKEKYGSHPQYATAVKEITMSDGSFAFVEFWTEELAATVIEFDGVTFQGRQLKIGRPAKFIPNGPLADPMDVQALRDKGVLPTSRNHHANMPGYGGKNTPLMRSLSQEEKDEHKRRYAAERWKGKGGYKGKGNNYHSGENNGENNNGENNDQVQFPPNAPYMMKGKGKGKGKAAYDKALQKQALAEKKARELYVGNLNVQLCNDDALRDLFTPACQMLPTYNEAAGPAVLAVDVRGGGTFAFVEFQNELMASEALNIFNKMEVGGRSINVGRPAGYSGPTENAETNYGAPKPKSPKTAGDDHLGSTNNTPANTPPSHGSNQQIDSNNTDLDFNQPPPPPPPGGVPNGSPNGGDNNNENSNQNLNASPSNDMMQMGQQNHQQNNVNSNSNQQNMPMNMSNHMGQHPNTPPHMPMLDQNGMMDMGMGGPMNMDPNMNPGMHHFMHDPSMMGMNTPPPMGHMMPPMMHPPMMDMMDPGMHMMNPDHMHAGAMAAQHFMNQGHMNQGPCMTPTG